MLCLHPGSMKPLIDLGEQDEFDVRGLYERDERPGRSADPHRTWESAYQQRKAAGEKISTRSGYVPHDYGPYEDANWALAAYDEQVGGGPEPGDPQLEPRWLTIWQALSNGVELSSWEDLGLREIGRRLPPELAQLLAGVITRARNPQEEWPRPRPHEPARP